MPSDGLERTRLPTELVPKLKALFSGRPDISLAFLFGSRAKGTATAGSDVDVGVYFTPSGGVLEIEEDRDDETLRSHRRAAEHEIWEAVGEIARTDVDIVILNTAPAPIACAALHDGIPLLVRDHELLGRFLLAVESRAEEDHAFVDDFVAVKARSRFLSRIDRTRLLRILDFIDAELADAGTFTILSREMYATQASMRRDLERWAENLVNASVDLARIVLASSGGRIPETYREAVRDLSVVPGFPGDAIARAAGFTRLRNLLAHEYLDVRYPELRRFVDEAPGLYGAIVRGARAWLAAQPVGG